ncbi:hypothetical protein GGQ13_003034 [Salinibacter ruber]|uniref:hypothetical protein n=1 Tax=Salinibacter ruber TaxID=146919 RepID=UPI0021684892|nr:hypothetical protein [Salinibacter ruber]MCS4139579.1 hypothetical protein [Salinibacter ruber]
MITQRITDDGFIHDIRDTAVVPDAIMLDDGMQIQVLDYLPSAEQDNRNFVLLLNESEPVVMYEVDQRDHVDDAADYLRTVAEQR